MNVNRILCAVGLALLSGVGTSWAQEKATEPDPSTKERLQLAREGYGELLDLTVQLLLAPPQEGRSASEWLDGRKAEEFYVWSKRWMDAERDMKSDEAGIISALEGHLNRMSKLERGQILKELMARGKLPITDEKAASDSKENLMGFTKRMRFFRVEAESWLSLSKKAVKKRNG